VTSGIVKVIVIPPVIILSPPRGKIGTTVTVYGFGWVPGSTITIKFNGVVIATCIAKNGGGFPSSCRFKVPSTSTYGTIYVVTATDTYGNSATVPFKVTK